MKAKGILAVILALAMVFALAACGSGTDQAQSSGTPSADAPENSAAIAANDDLQPITVRFAHTASTLHYVHFAALEMKEYVERESGGKITIEIYPNSQMGGEKENIEAVMNGTIEIASTTCGPLTSYVPEFMVMDIPYLFNSYEEAWMALDSNIGQKLGDSLNNYGMELMCYVEAGFRHITTTSTPIYTPDDLKGMKMRTMEAANHIKHFSAMGANPTPVSWTDLYMALSQHLVDGQENPVGNIFDINLYEVQKYCTLTGHLYDCCPIIANLDWYESLPAEYQVILKEGFAMLQNYTRFMNAIYEDQYIELLKEHGMTVIELTDAEKDAFRAIGQPAVTEAVEETLGKEYVQDFLDSILALRELETVQVA